VQCLGIAAGTRGVCAERRRRRAFLFARSRCHTRLHAPAGRAGGRDRSAVAAGEECRSPASGICEGRSFARRPSPGRRRRREPLERLAAELGIAERVVFTGWVAPEAVLGSIDVFALSSDTEQMPNALLAAMAASRPVAAVDVGDVKSIVCEDNREFVVSRDDGSAFGAAITRLLRDSDKRRALGEKNRVRVVSEYSQERMFATYSKILSAT
jgi:glycosyltransferase involved in cell wall biosynthesis